MRKNAIRLATGSRAVRHIAVTGFVALLFVAGVSSARVKLSRDGKAACRVVMEPTADSHFAALTWYVAHYKYASKIKANDRIAVMAGITEAEAVIFNRWARDKALEYPFLQWDRDEQRLSVRPDRATASRSDIDAAIAATDLQILIKPDAATGISFGWITFDRTGKKEFSAWIANHNHQLSKDMMSKRLLLRRDLIALRRDNIRDQLGGIDVLIAKKAYQEAYKALDQIKHDGSTEVMADMGRRRRQISEAIVMGEIKTVRDAGYIGSQASGALANLEAARDRWHQSHDFKTALEAERVLAEFQKLQHDIGTAMGTHAQEQLKALADKKHYWHAYQFHKSELDEARKYEPAVTGGIRSSLWKTFLSLIPDAFEHFRHLAEDEQSIDKGERYGTAMTIYAMIHDIEAYCKENQHELPVDTALVRWIARDETQARQITHELGLMKRRLVLGQIESEGVQGRLFRQALAKAIEDAVKESKVVFGIEISDESTGSTAYDYIIENGVYQPPTVQDLPQISKQRNVVLDGEIVTEDNEIYLDLLSRRKKTDGIDPYIYKQRSYSFTIKTVTRHSEATDAVVSYLSHHRTEKSRSHIELENPVRASFDQETVMEAKTADRPIAKDNLPANWQSLVPASYSPRIDPVPSPSRLKRTARNELIELVIHQNLRNLASYPFELAEDAAVATNMSKKANLLGLCFEYLSQTELSGDNIRFFDPSLTTKNLKADGLKNFELLEDLRILKAASWQNAVDVLLEIIEP